MDRRNNTNINMNSQSQQMFPSQRRNNTDMNNISNMNNPFQPMNPSQDESSIEDALYPEIYRKLSPIVDQLIFDMERQYGNIELTEDLLSQMADEVLRRAQMMPQTQMMSQTSDTDTIATINNFSGGSRDRNDRNIFGDIARILLLQQIFGGRRRPRWRRRY